MMQLQKALACGAVMLSLLTAASFARGQATKPVSLRQAVGDRWLIGAAVSTRELDDPRTAQLIVDQFNCLTAENDFKPAALQPQPGKVTFERADRIADFARDHGMKLIGHNLLWHQQTPPWMFTDENNQPLPRAQALENLKTHIETVVKHFDGKVLGWDVVNEAISDNPLEYLRDTPARQAIGDDYVVKAFQFAHAADPNVELYYNDYNIENAGKRDKAIRLINEIKGAGCRIDAVGIQGHWLLNFPETKVIDDAIARFSAQGVKVMITELDVDVLPRRLTADVTVSDDQGVDLYKNGLPDEVQEKLARRYAALFKVFAARRDAITRVTFWGVDDGHSWLNNWPSRGRTNHPLLWDRRLQAKPAFNAVIDALQ